MTSAKHKQIFGAARPAHTVIIARGEKVSHFTVRPVALFLASAAASAVVLGCVGMAAVFAANADLSVLDAEQQASARHAYEDRIASLRSQLDRVVSRQVMDRQGIDSKVETLLGQQAALSARYAKLQPLLERARTNGLLPQAVPSPTPKPSNDHAERTRPKGADRQLLSFEGDEGPSALDRFAFIDHAASAPSDPGIRFNGWKSRPGATAADLVHEIGRSIDTAEAVQIDDLDGLADGARRRAQAISGVLKEEGMPLRATAAPAANEGGPFVPVPEDQRFDAGCANLDSALTELQTIRDATGRLPLRAPLASSVVSSPFGVRPDPFFGRAAMHTGIDFVAFAGTDVAATAPGKVVQAGVDGGYGQMVEIDHGDGLTTRYGHLSSILVSVGETVAAGAVVGKVGSTGRSTGPHLHYEVRRDGQAVNPDRFLSAGRRISAFG